MVDALWLEAVSLGRTEVLVHSDEGERVIPIEVEPVGGCRCPPRIIRRSAGSPPGNCLLSPARPELTELRRQEFRTLKSQAVISSTGGRRFLHFVFAGEGPHPIRMVGPVRIGDNWLRRAKTLRAQPMKAEAERKRNARARRLGAARNGAALRRGGAS